MSPSCLSMPCAGGGDESDEDFQCSVDADAHAVDLTTSVYPSLAVSISSGYSNCCDDGEGLGFSSSTWSIQTGLDGD